MQQQMSLQQQQGTPFSITTRQSLFQTGPKCNWWSGDTNSRMNPWLPGEIYQGILHHKLEKNLMVYINISLF